MEKNTYFDFEGAHDLQGAEKLINNEWDKFYAD